jgi:hypothetical protein
VVEWNNVSGGVDANPDWASLEEELTRGDVWGGVSTQLIGVEGGPVLVQAPGTEGIVGKGLKALDPARYGLLEHPGDGYSFDIYTQGARALRRGGPAMGDVRPERVLAVGESQSAIALTTDYDGVQPLTQAFDGFLAHSRASVSLPLVAPGEYADLAGSIGNNTPAIFRTDLDTPVLELQAEADVTGILESVEVRQPDSVHFRLWEVAGTAHADVHLVGKAIADTLDCDTPINDGPMHLVAKAAWCSPANRARAPTCSASCWGRRSRCQRTASLSSIRRSARTSGSTAPASTRRSRPASCSRRTARRCSPSPTRHGSPENAARNLHRTRRIGGTRRVHVRRAAGPGNLAQERALTSA